MTAITNTTLENTTIEPVTVSDGDAVVRPMVLSALGDHAIAWLVGVMMFTAGILGAWGLLYALNWPDLSFLAAFSGALGLLYMGNLADVVRYRDAIVFTVPTLFIWTLLAMAPASAVMVGLALFTHVFLGFVGSFARTGGTLAELRLWPLLLGINLSFLIYLVSTWLA